MLDNFWNLTGLYQPWGPFNCAPGASLNFTFDTAAWLAASGVGLTLDQGGSSIDIAAPCVRLGGVSFAGSKMTARVQLAPDAVVTPGQFVKMAVTFRASDGQHDARTYYLRLLPR